ncbi:MAG: alanine racemase [Clostridia bacterium]|nr:alanine racemase [Clostridia bacterium]
MKSSLAGSKWIEIDLDAIKTNYMNIKQKLNPGVKFLGVVKADAYGHGAVEVGLLLEKIGADMLGVTTAEEGKELRLAGVSIPILVFGAFFPEDVELYFNFNLTATVACMESIQWLKQCTDRDDKSIKIHIKVETGMGRFGFWPCDVVLAAKEILKIPGLQLEGVYSHLAVAMRKNKSFSFRQFSVFQETCKSLEKAGIKGLIRHIANSSAVVDLPEMQLDMVRVGTLLYGQYPAPYMEDTLKLKDSWVFKAKIVYVRDLPRGQSVGYGRAFRTHKNISVAVLPIGVIDGFQVEPVSKPVNGWELFKNIAKLILNYFGYLRVVPFAIFKEGKGKVIGKVGMQYTMVDVSRVNNLKVGDVAQISARRTTMRLDIPKVYLENGRIVRVRVGSIVKNGIK